MNRYVENDNDRGLTVRWCKNFDPSANFPAGGLSSKSCPLSMHTQDIVSDPKIKKHKKQLSSSYPPKDAEGLCIT